MHSQLSLALRSLTRDKAFSVAVILSLALGIGANTAIFSLVNGVLLRPLPFPEPDRLVTVYEHIPRFSHLYPKLPVNFAHYIDWRTRATSFEHLALFDVEQNSFTGGAEPELVGGIRVSANLLATLGVRPALGRDLRLDEERQGRHTVVLLADSLWKRRFAADPGIVGRKVTLDGEPFEVIGVLPAGLRLPARNSIAGFKRESLPIEYIRPFGYDDDKLKDKLGEFNYNVIGRLRPGVSRQQGFAELNVIESEISRSLEEQLDLRTLVEPLHSDVTESSRPGLLLMLSAVGAVLLLLCVNLANLALARGASRSREFAIRTALGAGRGELLRRALAESLTLAILGGLIGVALAFASLGLLVRLAPADLPKIEDVAVDWRVLLFALAVSLACGLLFGILPALRTAGSDPQEALRAGSHTSTESRRGVRVRNLLVGFEAGLSVVLLLMAGLLIVSFWRLIHVDKGFDVERVIAAKVALPWTKYKEDASRTAFFDRLLESVGKLPGVVSSGLVSALPLQGEIWIDVLGTEGDARPMLERPTVNVRFVSPGYFKTLGIPLQDGRVFDESDRKRKVAMISHNMAEKLWPGQKSVVGRCAEHNEKKLLEVVGLLPDLRSTSLDADPVRILYIPYWQRPRTEASVVVRTAMDPLAMASALRTSIHAIDDQVPVPEIKTLVEVMNESVAHRRYQLTLISVFALAGLALASVGLYGVVSYGVVRRRNELGIRMALGAESSDVRRMVLRQGMTPVLLGSLAGLAAAFATTRLIRSMLFGITATDPATIVVVLAVLLSVSAAACLLPAVRATKINPVESLRYE